MRKFNTSINLCGKITLLITIGCVSLHSDIAEGKSKKVKTASRKISSISDLRIPDNFCVRREAIDKKMNSCEDNERYAKAAEYCLEQLDFAVDDVIAYYTPKGQEPKKYEDLDSLTGVYSEGFEYLVALNQKASSEIEGYKEFLYFPEDSDDDEVTDGDVEKYAMRVPCYGDTASDLNGALSDIKDDVELFQSLGEMAPAHPND